MAKLCLCFSDLELYFGSATAAAAAAESLYKLQGIEVDYGQPLPDADGSTAGVYQACVYIVLGDMCHCSFINLHIVD